MLVLVTGATGFIGRHLVHALITSGHQVRALSRETSDCSELTERGIQVVRRNGELMVCSSDACKGADVVVNLAGKMGGPDVTFEEMHHVNVDAVRALLEASHYTGVKQFIQCSTPGVVGMVGVAPECMPYRPAGVYEKTKCDGERLALEFHKKGHVPVTVVRPDFVYGPGDRHKLRMFRAIRDNRFPILSSGRSLLHPTYVDDVVTGIMLTIKNPAAYGQVFNIAGPRPVTVAELASEISAAVGAGSPSLRVPAFAARAAAFGAEVTGRMLHKAPALTRYQVDFFTRDHASDISKAQQMLAYEPAVDITEGVPRTAAWYRENGLI